MTTQTAAEIDPSLASIVLGDLTQVDQAGMLERIKGLIAASWFPQGESPVLDATLSGGAYNLAWIYVLYQYVLKQARIATASGIWLDRISYDFFGTRLPRRSGEGDDQYRDRIIAEILRPRSTRAAIIEALNDLTGFDPTIIELWNPGDCGAYGNTVSDLGVMGYDHAGKYGDLALHNQFLVDAERPSGGGIAYIDGYGSPAGGYLPNEPQRFIENGLLVSGIYGMSPQQKFRDGGQFEYTADEWSTIQATDDEIYATVAQTIAAGMTAWVSIKTAFDTVDAPRLYFGNVDNTEDLALVTSFFF